MAGAIILKISHGYTIAPNDDPFVKLADEALLIFSAALTPNAHIVDVFPILRFLPEWLPGMGFKKSAKEFRKVVMDFLNKPFAFVKHQMVSTHSSTNKGLCTDNNP